MKRAYPMRVTLRKAKDGSFTAQVNIQEPNGAIHRTIAHELSQTPLPVVVNSAVAKVEGHAEAEAEAKDNQKVK